jgi:DNA repair protein RadA/Sms
VEQKRSPTAAAAARPALRAVKLSDISADAAPRVSTANPEFDRALGGGVVPGSVILLGGEPGIGKSTLLLQIAQNLQAHGRRVLYVSGEESAQQIKLRSDRLGSAGTDMMILPEARLESVLDAVDELQPTDLILDSVQTACSDTLDSAPGSISQVRHVTARLSNLAKSRNLPVFIIGHVTKDGSIAGPKALEHMVDAVLYFEGERRHNHRIVRAVKNRFGAANEIGIFHMSRSGLHPVQNASNLFLQERESSRPGSAVICALEGSRTILVEVQALVVSSHYGTARRTCVGVDYNRLSVLVAMLEKRLEIPMVGCDIYVNAAGGLQIDEPASDLGVLAAILSSFRNRPIASSTVLLGELGLSGEVRPVSNVFARIREAAAMGFRKCLAPGENLPLVEPVEGVELIPLNCISELSDAIF